MASLARYALSFYVPHSALQACKDALFAAGAGTYPGGKYSHACFETAGTGLVPTERGRGAGDESRDDLCGPGSDGADCYGVGGASVRGGCVLHC
jgi:hypothetical protein